MVRLLLGPDWSSIFVDLVKLASVNSKAQRPSRLLTFIAPAGQLWNFKSDIEKSKQNEKNIT